MENPRLTYAEYLAQERASATKHEFLRGDVWAMAGTLELASIGARVAVDDVYFDPRG
jgi:hypothetical protein